MLNKPDVDTLIEKLGADGKPISRFELCSVASKRARQIITAKDVITDKIVLEDNELSMACKEIAEGKVIISKD